MEPDATAWAGLPPPVTEALWRGLTTREGGVAVHFAGLLTYLHGQASSPFD